MLKVRKRFRLTALVVSSMLAVVGGSSPASAVGDLETFPFRHDSLLPLRDARTYVLYGEKLENGGCRYRYPAGPDVIPPSGWELRTIGVDMEGCRKLLEEGTPTDVSQSAGEGTEASEVLASVAAKATSGSAGFSLASTKGAWQRVYWKDFPGVVLTHDVTQINWTYNGSTVQSGNAAGYFYRIGSWGLVTSNTTQGFFSGAFRGHTNSKFGSEFCLPLPMIYTYYYHNRVWGHANGTSTRSESSDSVDECLPLFKGIQSAYGQWS
jgi:hypothetical protein